MRTFRIKTFGCKANSYDSERLAEALVEGGLRRADDEAEPPDVLIVNTCTVTHVADRKCRRAIRRAIRDDSVEKVFVTGCYASASPEDIADIEGVDGVFPGDEVDSLLDTVLAGHGAGRFGDFGVSSFGGRSRAMLKIQDGCDFYCNYCIIPHVRGEPRSMLTDRVVEEGRQLVDNGYREIVLTGIHLGLYGQDLESSTDLADVVDRLAHVDGLDRLRLSSLEAPEVTQRLLSAMQHPVVCPHLHLPLQSGDDAVLERMGRRYSRGEFRHYVQCTRDQLDAPAITTDVMVGFPGETDDEFQNTLDFCREMQFSRMHVFKYSPRSGTPAAEMDDQVHSKVAGERSRLLRELAGEMAEEWAQQFVGRKVRVLLEEQVDDNLVRGYTDRYVETQVRAEDDVVGQIKWVTGSESRDGCLVGIIDE